MLDLINVRKELHKIPELAFEEFKTKEYLINVLETFKDIKMHTFDFPGILVEYSHGKGEYKLFRSDMDALPIKEETGCNFASEHPGKMHACGHDMHMTILIGLIERVIRENLEQNLLFLFQPAEEGKGGAKRILETGVLDKYEISEAYALHVKGDIPVGTVSSRSGIFFANTEEVDVIFNGRSAHVALAEKGIDALYAGFEFYRIVNEKIKVNFPDQKNILCKFGRMEAGSVRNAVAANCIMEGTLRALETDDLKKIERIIKNCAQIVSEKIGVQWKVNIFNFYTSVINNKTLYQRLLSRLGNIKFEPAKIMMGGEDFGFFAKKYKGLLILLGANQGEEQDLHSSGFLPDEKAIEVGVQLFRSLIQ